MLAKLFRTESKFMDKAFKKCIPSNGKWYCYFNGSIREGDTREEAIQNAYKLWREHGA